MTKFLDWDSGATRGALWLLRDGEPEMMAPRSDAHGAIQGALHPRIEDHLVAGGRATPDPVTLIAVISRSNEAQTRADAGGLYDGSLGR